MHSDYSYPQLALAPFQSLCLISSFLHAYPQIPVFFVLFCDQLSLNRAYVDPQMWNCLLEPSGITNGDSTEDRDYPPHRSITSLLCPNMECVSCYCCPFFTFSFWYGRYMRTHVYEFCNIHIHLLCFSLYRKHFSILENPSFQKYMQIIWLRIFSLEAIGLTGCTTC